MEINIKTTPISDGKYSVYFPIKFVVSEASNPEFLYFKIRKSDGTPIPEIPFYKAYNINNDFHFDAAAYLKSIFDVRSEQGLSTTSIEELTDVYGRFEVVINLSAVLSGGSITNHFYAFAMLENRKYLNEATANYAINKKHFLYSNDSRNIEPAMNFFPSKTQGKQDRINMFVTETGMFSLLTYSVNNPLINAQALEWGSVDLSAYVNKLVSIPLNKTFIQNNFIGIFTSNPIGFIPYKSIRLMSEQFGNTYLDNIAYNSNVGCNFLEFVYVNKYGVKENITFNATEDESLKTKSKQFLAHGYNAEGNTLTFNTSADRQKISQQTTITKKVEGKKMLIKRIESVKDFLTSPVVWHVGDELKQVVLSDGTYKLTKENKGLEVSFKYSSSQTKPSFL